MNIRGHHLLCIFGFKGLGYNDRFSLNIAKVIDYLKSNPAKKFKVVISCDVICDFCPHLVNGKCRRNGLKSDQNVIRHDIRVIEDLGIKHQSFISYNSLKKRIIKSDINLNELCNGCNWLELGYCSEGIKNLKVENNKEI